MKHFLAKEKALGVGDDHQCCIVDSLSLETKVSLFLDDHFHDQSSLHISDHHDPFDHYDDDDYDSDGNYVHDSNQRTFFWDSQEALLLEIIERYQLSGYKFRQEIIRTIEGAKATDFCKCSKPSPEVDGCARCLRQKVVKLLCDKGFNATVYTSTWKSTKKFPGGSHDYIKVIANTPKRKKQVSFIIELEFRDEFEIAKPCKEYRRIVNLVPKYYIGKPDYLNAIVRVVCAAAKKSMQEKKIFIGPWRKKSFMQMKWSGSHDQTALQRRSYEFSNNYPRHALPATDHSHHPMFTTAASPVIVT